jgi:hypothetical protein
MGNEVKKGELEDKKNWKKKRKWWWWKCECIEAI